MKFTFSPLSMNSVSQFLVSAEESRLCRNFQVVPGKELEPRQTGVLPDEATLIELGIW